MLSFGPWAPGYINPLDGDLVVTDKRKQASLDFVFLACYFTALSVALFLSLFFSPPYHTVVLNKM